MEMMNKLYEASNAELKSQLIIRGFVVLDLNIARDERKYRG
jgi:polyphosphate kinase